VPRNTIIDKFGERIIFVAAGAAAAAQGAKMKKGRGPLKKENKQIWRRSNAPCSQSAFKFVIFCITTAKRV